MNHIITIICILCTIMAINITIVVLLAALYDFTKLDESLKKYVYFEEYGDSWIHVFILCCFLSLWLVYRVVIANHVQTIHNMMKELTE